MTIEEIRTLGLEELETRAAEIAEEIREADAETLDAINAELDAIEARKAVIVEENEQRKKAMEDIVNGAGKAIEVPAEEKREKPMENRNSREYLDAWVEMMKGRATQEQRTQLTELNEDGTIAIPTYVEDRINTAWENNEILNRVKKSYLKGIVRVPVEVSSDGAVVHSEGTAAISEENLVIEFIQLVPSTVKKMVKYTTEVLDLKGSAWVDYVFDEIEYKIVQKVSDLLVTDMLNKGTTFAAATALIGTADIVGAEGLLSGEAANPVFITTRAIAARIKAEALNANYGYDPFDGLDVIYVDPAVFTAAGKSGAGIVADLSGVQVNFPAGDQPTFVVDEYTEAPADIVRVIGRLMAAVGVVSTGKVVVIIPND